MIIGEQLYPFLGIEKGLEESAWTLHKILYVLKHLGDTVPIAAMYGLASLVILLGYASSSHSMLNRGEQGQCFQSKLAASTSGG